MVYSGPSRARVASLDPAVGLTPALEASALAGAQVLLEQVADRAPLADRQQAADVALEQAVVALAEDQAWRGRSQGSGSGRCRWEMSGPGPWPEYR